MGAAPWGEGFNEAEMREAVAAIRTTLTTLPGLGTVLAAKVIGCIGDMSWFPTEHHFASYTGSAPPGRLQRQQRPPLAQHLPGSGP
ncbi:transposase [Streptomyces sp. NPDC001948]